MDPELSITRPLRFVEQYEGSSSVFVSATQFDPSEATPAAARRILGEWVEFFTATATRITRLELTSRVPQVLLDAVGHQSQLEHLSLSWGPYSDLAPLRALQNLRSLSLGSAVAVRDLSPLTSLLHLESLVLEQPHRVDELAPLGELTTLRELIFGASISSDRVVRVRGFDWIRPLTRLRTLLLPGVSMNIDEVAVLLELPELERLGLPLRRRYRALVFEHAEHNAAFADAARRYEEYERTWGIAGAR